MFQVTWADPVSHPRAHLSVGISAARVPQPPGPQLGIGGMPSPPSPGKPQFPLNSLAVQSPRAGRASGPLSWAPFILSSPQSHCWSLPQGPQDTQLHLFSGSGFPQTPKGLVGRRGPDECGDNRWWGTGKWVVTLPRSRPLCWLSTPPGLPRRSWGQQVAAGPCLTTLRLRQVLPDPQSLLALVTQACVLATGRPGQQVSLTLGRDPTTKGRQAVLVIQKF